MEIGRINGKIDNSTGDSVKSKAQDDSFEKRLKAAADKNDDKELKKVCKDFEGIFLKMMYKQMKATVQKSDLIPEDQGNAVFESMLDDSLMDKASESNGIGLADVLYKQLGKQLKSAYKPENGGNDEAPGDK